MTPQRVFAATMMLALCFGMVPEAHAIARCGDVCGGKKEPCSLKCYLPGPFVTTCGEVGPCVATDKQKKTTNKKKSPNQKTSQQQQSPEGAKTQ